ncbi:MAG: hypothetical protein WA636_07180, partial [Methylovirgula sp.]
MGKKRKRRGDSPAKRGDFASLGAAARMEERPQVPIATDSATPDFDRLSENLAVLVGESGKALAALF